MRINPLVYMILICCITIACKAKKEVIDIQGDRIIVLLEPETSPKLILDKYKHLSIVLIGASSKIENSYIYHFDKNRLLGEDILQSLTSTDGVISAEYSKKLNKPRVDTNYKPNN